MYGDHFGTVYYQFHYMNSSHNFRNNDIYIACRQWIYSSHSPSWLQVMIPGEQSNIIKSHITNNYMVVSRKRGTPKHPCLDGIFPNKNHPLLGTRPWWTPPYFSHHRAQTQRVTSPNSSTPPAMVEPRKKASRWTHLGFFIFHMGLSINGDPQ